RRDGPRSRLGLAARWIDRQFDDDQNRFPLGGFVAVDARAALPLHRGLEVFVAGENLLDRRYDAARTPTPPLAPPRLPPLPRRPAPAPRLPRGAPAATGRRPSYARARRATHRLEPSGAEQRPVTR